MLQARRTEAADLVVRLLSGLCAVILLSGCTPEEKTVALPGEETRTAEGEESWDGESFSVKRIYTFSYETSAALEQSAFIKGCKENEIRVIARQEEAEGDMLVARTVDYRYGFYETEGEFLQLKENWAEKEGGEMEGELYIGKMLPSPDGKQILAYIFSAFSDYNAVQLYQLGALNPWLLYEGEGGAGGAAKGAFTSDGRWVTFDVSGIQMGEEMVVPVYDCQQMWAQQNTLTDDSARLYPPDLVLPDWAPDYEQLWEARLEDFLGEVGRTGICGDDDGRLIFVEDFPGNRSSYSLAGEVGTSMSYLQYELSEEENKLYYLVKDTQLWSMDLTQQTFGDPIVFKEKVLDFLRLETGDILVLAISEQRDDSMGNHDYIANTDPIGEADSRLMMIQKFWNLRSVDLYLYPAEGGEGELLYKGIRDLAAIEYDEENGRILLETWEEGAASQRKCLVLELR